ncbi:MAG: helix-turn-helix transcriptional regulator [Thaumarchaeota archaeon]|jgi:transposase|nr:helix-turn-helix transcriptional regulator [Candidatus Geocrenenecus arthurdayi]
MDVQLLEEARLTARQRQILQLVNEGHSVRDVCRILGLSRSTIYYHLSKAVEKIEALQAEKEYHDRIRKLEERISKLEQDFLRHIFEDHIIERFLRS